MSHAARAAGALRAAALLLALAAGCWLLAQACTLSWVAADAEATLQRARSGLPLRSWQFTDPAAVVAPGSEGLEGAQRGSRGLAPQDGQGVVDLSLALDGRPLPVPHFRAALLTLESTVPLRARLLGPSATGAVQEFAQVAVPAGMQQVRLPLEHAQVPAGWMRLRIERSAPGRLWLHSLALVEPRDGEVRRIEVAPQTTPEALLRARDRLQAIAPAAVVGVAGVPFAAAVAAVRGAGWLPALALAAALLVLGWAAWARWQARRVAGAQPGSARQLLLLFAVPVLLLATGHPARHDGAVTTLAFLVACVAALVHPGGRRDWHLLGGARAWRAVAGLTLAGLALLAAIALVGAWLGHAPGEWRADRVPRYLAWAVLQQSLLLLAITPRLMRPGRDLRVAMVLSGGVFALLHLPNFVLMLATLLAGAAWARLGQRHGALLPLALSHALLGTVFAWAASPWLLRSAEIGGRFLMPPPLPM